MSKQTFTVETLELWATERHMKLKLLRWKKQKRVYWLEMCRTAIRKLSKGMTRFLRLSCPKLPTVPLKPGKVCLRNLTTIFLHSSDFYVISNPTVWTIPVGERLIPCWKNTQTT